ncbi:MAG TPA: protein phosphatase 2C domain-containing protein [Mycobacteriales bacterium]|nr:protein phosphatase 2C domain-containing protein [Mycobacteriales bacterium]
MTLTLNYAARSHTGLLREGNEDSAFAGARLLAVADGMGGHAAGEVASAVAIAALAGLDEDVPGADLLAALKQAAESANEHLTDMVRGDPALEGMGTTLTALLSAGNRLGLLHIGDSRCYLLRDGELNQITRDHTLVQALIDEGRISEEEATTHPQRSVIMRVLDGRPGLELDLSVREARAGDRYLLCSDGLTGPVASIDTLREALAGGEPQDVADHLVQLALRGGGPDNVTVIVADVVDRDTNPGVEPVVVGSAAEAAQPGPPGIADTAAGRARVATGGSVEDEPIRAAVLPHRPRSGRRTAVVLLTLLGLLAVGAGAGWAYVRSQYYVGVDGGNVAVFRGVAGEVAGVRLSSVAERTTLSMNDLDEIDMARLADGIHARDRADAREIVERLETRADECALTPTPQAVVSPAPPRTSVAPSLRPSTPPLPAAQPCADALPTPTPSATL